MRELELYGLVEIELKSDQNGIEIEHIHINLEN